VLIILLLPSTELTKHCTFRLVNSSFVEPEPQGTVSFFLLKPEPHTNVSDFECSPICISQRIGVKTGTGTASYFLPGTGAALI
jgi:hypothetical protein